MQNKIHRYELKRLDKKNVQRSLQGAVKRSYDGNLILSFVTKSVRLPDEYEQHKIPDGGAYMEVSSDGRFSDDYLKIVISGWTPDGNGMFINNAGIKLREIEGSIYVCYGEPVLSDPEKVKTKEVV